MPAAIWLPRQDSNLGFQLQRLTCCRYTMGQSFGFYCAPPGRYRQDAALSLAGVFNARRSGGDCAVVPRGAR